MSKIKFKNVGNKSQYEIDLFELTEYAFDIANASNGSQSYTEMTLNLIHDAVKKRLELSGFDDLRAKYILKDGNIIKCQNGELLGVDLFVVIQDRDQSLGGQSAEYLAALIERKCWVLTLEWQGKWWQKGDVVIQHVLDEVSIIINLYHCFCLYDLQLTHSVGASFIENNKKKAQKKRKGQRSKFIKLIKREMRAYKSEDKTLKQFIIAVKNNSLLGISIKNLGRNQYEITHEDFEKPLKPMLKTLSDWFRCCMDKVH